MHITGHLPTTVPPNPKDHPIKQFRQTPPSNFALIRRLRILVSPFCGMVQVVWRGIEITWRSHGDHIARPRMVLLNCFVYKHMMEKGLGPVWNNRQSNQLGQQYIRMVSGNALASETVQHVIDISDRHCPMPQEGSHLNGFYQTSSFRDAP